MRIYKNDEEGFGIELEYLDWFAILMIVVMVGTFAVELSK